jgi:hypothetical protein
MLPDSVQPFAITAAEGELLNLTPAVESDIDVDTRGLVAVAANLFGIFVEYNQVVGVESWAEISTVGVIFSMDGIFSNFRHAPKQKNRRLPKNNLIS